MDSPFSADLCSIVPPITTSGLFTAWLFCCSPVLLFPPVDCVDVGWSLHPRDNAGPLLPLHPGLHWWHWISGSPASPPRCVHGASRRKFVCLDGAIPCGADCSAAVPTVPTNSCPFILCFVSSSLLSVLGTLRRHYINYISYYHYN